MRTFEQRLQCRELFSAGHSAADIATQLKLSSAEAVRKILREYHKAQEGSQINVSQERRYQLEAEQAHEAFFGEGAGRAETVDRFRTVTPAGQSTTQPQKATLPRSTKRLKRTRGPSGSGNKDDPIDLTSGPSVPTQRPLRPSKQNRKQISPPSHPRRNQQARRCRPNSSTVNPVPSLSKQTPRCPEKETSITILSDSDDADSEPDFTNICTRSEPESSVQEASASQDTSIDSTPSHGRFCCADIDIRAPRGQDGWNSVLADVISSAWNEREFAAAIPSSELPALSWRVSDVSRQLFGDSHARKRASVMGIPALPSFSFSSYTDQLSQTASSCSVAPARSQSEVILGDQDMMEVSQSDNELKDMPSPIASHNDEPVNDDLQQSTLQRSHRWLHAWHLSCSRRSPSEGLPILHHFTQLSILPSNAEAAELDEDEGGYFPFDTPPRQPSPEEHWQPMEAIGVGGQKRKHDTSRDSTSRPSPSPSNVSCGESENEIEEQMTLGSDDKWEEDGTVQGAPSAPAHVPHKPQAKAISGLGTMPVDIAPSAHVNMTLDLLQHRTGLLSPPYSPAPRHSASDTKPPRSYGWTPSSSPQRLKHSIGMVPRYPDPHTRVSLVPMDYGSDSHDDSEADAKDDVDEKINMQLSPRGAPNGSGSPTGLNLQAAAHSRRTFDIPSKSESANTNTTDRENSIAPFLDAIGLSDLLPVLVKAGYERMKHLHDLAQTVKDAEIAQRLQGELGIPLRKWYLLCADVRGWAANQEIVKLDAVGET